jgi:hypothetical protein
MIFLNRPPNSNEAMHKSRLRPKEWDMWETGNISTARSTNATTMPCRLNTVWLRWHPILAGFSSTSSLPGPASASCETRDCGCARGGGGEILYERNRKKPAAVERLIDTLQSAAAAANKYNPATGTPPQREQREQPKRQQPILSHHCHVLVLL